MQCYIRQHSVTILGEMMVNLVMKRRDAWGIHQPAPMNEKGHEKKYIP